MPQPSLSGHRKHLNENESAMKILLGTAAIALGLAATTLPALADDDRHCGRVDRAQWLSLPDVAARVAAMGYDARKIEADDGCWEVKARASDGARVELHLHPVTAEIVKRDVDDDDDRYDD
ncbi:PepSY domain-containing protein [Zavarzinia sp. CC-PAN008]|uniref:PepSY domain-containing protein n=1 Tax=Zavarzinia sp. CC-PAN008 TaxID=3243332 RepID=UPI003F7473B2